MPNISISNYPKNGYEDMLAGDIRQACLDAHKSIPVLGEWGPSDVAIALLAPTLFESDDAPIQIVVEVLYQKPERTLEVLQKFGKLLIAATKESYPKAKFEVTFRPLVDPAYVVCSE